MGSIECWQPASKSSWDSQDFGDISMVLKMADFRKSTGPRWVKQITYSHLISRFFHISTANYSIITPEPCFSNIYNKRQNNLNFEYQAKMHPISWASFIRAGNIFERDDVHILLNGKVINLCYMSLNTYNRECTLNPLPEGIISRRYQSVNEHWKLHF